MSELEEIKSKLALCMSIINSPLVVEVPTNILIKLSNELADTIYSVDINNRTSIGKLKLMIGLKELLRDIENTINSRN